MRAMDKKCSDTISEVSKKMAKRKITKTFLFLWLKDETITYLRGWGQICYKL